MAAVRPYPQPASGLRQQLGAERPAVAAAAVSGVDDQFGGRCLHRVGVLQLPVSDEFLAVLRRDVHQQMAHPLPPSAPQLQPPLFGHGGLSVGTRGPLDQPEGGRGLLRCELVGHLNPAAGPARLLCSVSHARSVRPCRVR